MEIREKINQMVATFFIHLLAFVCIIIVNCRTRVQD